MTAMHDIPTYLVFALGWEGQRRHVALQEWNIGEVMRPLVLESTGELIVNVVRIDGEAVRSATLCVYDCSGRWALPSEMRKEQGGYLLADLPPGQLQLFGSTVRNGKTLAALNHIEIRPNSTAEHELSLLPAGRLTVNMVGTRLEDAGSPVLLQLSDDNGGSLAVMSGRETILPAGLYYVRPVGVERSSAPSVVVDAESTTVITLSR